MALFLSTYVNKIDKKGRVSVPARFRAVLAEQNAGSPSFNGVVAFLSLSSPAIDACGMDFMESLVRGLDSFNPYSDEHDDFADALMPLSYELLFDGDGRITLPPELLEEAGITDKAAFVGRGDRFQIWEPEAFRKRQAEALANARKNRAAMRRVRPDEGSSS